MYLKYGHRRTVMYVLIGCLIFALLFASGLGSQAFAQGSAFGSTVLSWIYAFAHFFVVSGVTIFFKTIEFSIIKFSEAASGLNGNSILTIIQPFWELLRDIVNIGITVLFIFTAVRGISKELSFGKVRLVYLLLAGLLNNFSAFFVFVLLDISNAIVLLFYVGVSQTGNIIDEFLVKLIDLSGNGIIESSALAWFIVIFLLVISFVIFFIFILFSLLLLDRFVRSLFLIIVSPVLVFGFFLRYSRLDGDGDTPLEKYILERYDSLLASVGKIFLSPIILFVGLLLANLLFVASLSTTLGASFSGTTDAGILNISVDKINADAWGFFVGVVVASLVYLIVLYKTALLAIAAGGGTTLNWGTNQVGDRVRSKISNPVRRFLAGRKGREVRKKEEAIRTGKQLLGSRDYTVPARAKRQIRSALDNIEHSKPYEKDKGKRDLSKFNLKSDVNKLAKLNTKYGGAEGRETAPSNIPAPQSNSTSPDRTASGSGTSGGQGTQSVDQNLSDSTRTPGSNPGETGQGDSNTSTNQNTQRPSDQNSEDGSGAQSGGKGGTPSGNGNDKSDNTQGSDDTSKQTTGNSPDAAPKPGDGNDKYDEDSVDSPKDFTKSGNKALRTAKKWFNDKDAFITDAQMKKLRKAVKDFEKARKNNDEIAQKQTLKILTKLNKDIAFAKSIIRKS